MRRFSANYIFTVYGEPIRNGIVGVDDDGTIIEIIDPKGEEKELAGTEYHNGVIVPGFVNAHCHTELAHLKGKIKPETGLAGFVNQIRALRNDEEIVEGNLIVKALEQLKREGIVAVADICNSSDSFWAKRESPIHCKNLIEVFGLSAQKADKYIEKARLVLKENELKGGGDSYLTPHSVYSLSTELWTKIAQEIRGNSLVSIHFAESKQEREFTVSKSGELAKSYTECGLPIEDSPLATPVEIVKRYMPKNSRILFVHNTFLTQGEVQNLKNFFPNAYFVLCPESNLFIENALPDIPMFHEMGLTLALGTDSYASSPSLSMLEQVRIINKHFPTIPFCEILRWSTLNGAKALGLDHEIGSIELGKKPGLNLISPFDFSLMIPNLQSRVKRLA
jgi:cytosine/adenosine deaminase-related metal-dependent hydrolase